MIERVEFEVHTETPTPDHYRHDWVPAPEVELGGIWGPAVVTAGRRPVVLRAPGLERLRSTA